ncbi:MAG TPA: hypothetical protein VF950_13760 [Planctomycetota bacterium]
MLKRAAAGAGIAAAAALIAWTAGLFYYQRKVAAAIEHLREEHLRATEPGSFRDQARTSVMGITALGCRALPALVAELDPDVSPYYLCRVADCLTDLSDGEAPRVVFEDDPGQRRKSVDALRAWWEGGGRRRHDWWRFWTSKCVR